MWSMRANTRLSAGFLASLLLVATIPGADTIVPVLDEDPLPSKGATDTSGLDWRECEVHLFPCETLSVDETFTFSAEGTPEGGTYRWTVTQPGEQLSPTGGTGGRFEVTALEPSESVDDVEVSVTYTTSSGERCSAACVLTVVQFTIKSVTFSGPSFYSVKKDCDSGDCPTYETPHWLDLDADGEASGPDEHESPVAFVRGTEIALSDVLFNAMPVDLGLNAVLVRGVGPDGCVFEGSASVGYGEVIVYDDMVAGELLPAEVSVYDTYDIDWYIALDNFKLHPAGTSRNRVYVTFGNPMGKRLESFLDISTRAADGQSTLQEVIDAVWAEYEDLHVTNVRGEVMGYYRGILCASWCKVLTAQQLVVHLNGQCHSWQDLLIQCFRTQGIGGAQDVEIRPISDGAFIIENYWFAPGEGTSGIPAYPYRWNDPCGWGLPWPPETVEVRDRDGLAGQDESNPSSWFPTHQIVKLYGKYYDPSYGFGPLEGTTEQVNMFWEQSVVAGYCVWGSGAFHRGVRKDRFEVRETWFDK